MSASRRIRERKMWWGQKVHVRSADNKRDLGVWKFVGDVETDPFPFIKVPVFKQGKKRIYGWACWWILESEHQKIIKSIKAEEGQNGV